MKQQLNFDVNEDIKFPSHVTFIDLFAGIG